VFLEFEITDNEAIRNFTENVITYLSSLTLKASFSKKKGRGDPYLKIAIVPAIIDKVAIKEIIVSYKNIKEIERFIDMLRYFRFNRLSVMSESVIVRKFPSIMTEVWSPSALASAHISLKKLLPVVRNVVCRRKFSFNVKRSAEKFHALLLASLLSGGHRRGISLRQLAAQNLITLLAISNSSDEAIVNNVAKGLAALAADVYVWLPRLYFIKRGVFGSEIHYSLATSDLDSLVEYLSKQEFIERYTEFLEITYEEIKNAISSSLKDNPLKLASEIANKIGDCLRKTVCFEAFSGKRETLLGYYRMVKGRLEEIKGTCSNRDVANGKLVTVLTEQTSLLFIVTLVRELKTKDIILLYTPQVLYERLLLEDFVNYWNNNVSRESQVTVDYIPVPALDPGATYDFINAILSKMNKDTIKCIIARGPMSLALPLTLVAKKNGIQEVML